MEFMGGGSGVPGGEGGSSGDSTPPEPPPMPPVPDGKEPPSKPPIEIEVPDDDDLDLDLGEEAFREAFRQGIWRISFSDTDSTPQRGAENLMVHIITLVFDALKTGGEDMFGHYMGEGTLVDRQDNSGFHAAAGGLLSLGMGWAGPIEPVSFELIYATLDPEDGDEDLGSLVSSKDDDDLAPLVPPNDDDDLAPLVPPNDDDDLGSLVPPQPEGWRGKLIGYAMFTMTVHSNIDENWYQEHVLGSGGPAARENLSSTFDWEIYIQAYDSGMAILYITEPGYSKRLEFWGRISRKIDGKQVGVR